MRNRLGGWTRPLATVALLASATVATGAVLAAPASAATSAGSATPTRSTFEGSYASAAGGYDAAAQPGSMAAITRQTGARDLWQHGLTGAGVDVALIDTGVAPVTALADPSKVVVGPDLSFESQNSSLRYLDTYGHGTVMAGIIAGRDVARGRGTGYARDTSHFYGMAPDSRLVSVKVGTHNGAVDVSQLVAAIDWVVQHRHSDGLNIKVLNLSFGTDSRQSWQLDPLAQAAEVATRAGILVVTAGGNDGQTTSGLADPGYDPHVVAVGAVDTKGTASVRDDQVPDFSQHSASAMDGRGPDLVAPGVGVVAPAVSGSYLAGNFPAAISSDGKYIRGSGTSQAAAVVSGAAALLWQRWPNLGPVQIRQLLVESTTPVSRTTTNYDGHGELDLTKALALKPAATTTAASKALGITGRQATGFGSLQAARGNSVLTIDGVPLLGERDIHGHPWVSPLLATAAARYAAWSGGTFNGTAWIGGGFSSDTVSVAGRTWGGRTWAGRTWAGNAWSGRTWAGRTWAAQTWNGSTWAGASWTDAVDTAGGGWVSRTWAGSTWG